MTTDQYQDIIAAIADLKEEFSKDIVSLKEEVSKDIARIDRDLGTDRQDLQKYSEKMDSFNRKLEGVEKLLKTQVTKVGDTVIDAVQPITDTLDQVKKEKWWKKYIKRG